MQHTRASTFRGSSGTSLGALRPQSPGAGPYGGWADGPTQRIRLTAGTPLRSGAMNFFYQDQQRYRTSLPFSKESSRGGFWGLSAAFL